MCYVKIGDEGFIDIEEAVIYAEDMELKSAVIDAYNEKGECVERQTINSADNYRYYAYAIFEANGYTDANEPEWVWYNGHEVFYNTVDECERVLESAHSGKYQIAAVYQDLSGYIDVRVVMNVEIGITAV